MVMFKRHDVCGWQIPLTMERATTSLFKAVLRRQHVNGAWIHCVCARHNNGQRRFNQPNVHIFALKQRNALSVKPFTVRYDQKTTKINAAHLKIQFKIWLCCLAFLFHYCKCKTISAQRAQGHSKSTHKFV